MTTTHLPGWIELDGVDNMRDVGGLPTTDGGAVAAGRLIRSDNLQELSPASVRHLVDDLGVTDVVDLRTYVEVAKEGDGPLVRRAGRPVSTTTRSTPRTPRRAGSRPASAALPWETDRNMGTAAKVRRPAKWSHGETGRSPGSAKEDRKHDAYWSKHYLGYLDRRPDSVVAALRAIGEATAPWSSTAPPARTGPGRSSGSRSSSSASPPRPWSPTTRRRPSGSLAILERLARHPAYAANLEGKTVAQQEPRAETMRLLVEALDREGGAEAWLHQHGWTDEDTERLRAKLLSADDDARSVGSPA